LIEVKEDSINFKKTAKYLYHTIYKSKLNIYLCSFNYKFINYFHQKYKRIKCGLIIGQKINKKHISNNLEFNSINYKYKGKIPSKETFWWTINKIEKIGDKENIITDIPKQIYEYLK
ncbi:MAG: hypothetical protein IKG27_00930, partial [Bacilli bacterium]|nr:hypothetical protein [Bacilli bacterium]